MKWVLVLVTSLLFLTTIVKTQEQKSTKPETAEQQAFHKFEEDDQDSIDAEEDRVELSEEDNEESQLAEKEEDENLLHKIAEEYEDLPSENKKSVCKLHKLEINHTIYQVLTWIVKVDQYTYRHIQNVIDFMPLALQLNKVI